MTPGTQTPDRFSQLKPHVRQFFAELDPDDIVLLKSGMEFARWSRTTGKLLKTLGLGSLAVFGALAAGVQGWDFLIARFFTENGG